LARPEESICPSIYGEYDFGSWRADTVQPIAAIESEKDGVWSIELQDTNHYTRSETGSLDGGDINDPNAEQKRIDLFSLRDFQLETANGLSILVSCYKYWIALRTAMAFA
jgi:hypothetical protein